MDKRKGESVQRRATKLIPELKDKTYEERLRYLKIPSLVYRRKRGDMIWMYKIMDGLGRLETTKLFVTSRMSAQTRSRAKTVFKKHSVGDKMQFFLAASRQRLESPPKLRCRGTMNQRVQKVTTSRTIITDVINTRVHIYRLSLLLVEINLYIYLSTMLIFKKKTY